jgi:hypothetical protein
MYIVIVSKIPNLSNPYAMQAKKYTLKYWGTQFKIAYNRFKTKVLNRMKVWFSATDIGYLFPMCPAYTRIYTCHYFHYHTSRLCSTNWSSETMTVENRVSLIFPMPGEGPVPIIPYPKNSTASPFLQNNFFPLKIGDSGCFCFVLLSLHILPPISQE